MTFVIFRGSKKMAKSSSTSNKEKINSASNGTSNKTVHRDSAVGKSVNGNKGETAVSKADELTLRAWKKTFENRKKAA